MSEQDSFSGTPVGPGWVPREIRGRGASGEKGLATAHSMRLQGPGDAEFVVGRLQRNHEIVDVEILALAGQMTFDRCPICLEPAPTCREHVPPAAIGGSVMTRTCTRCNNELGSRLEAPLVDWWEDAVGSVSLSHDDVPGPRRAARVLLRQKDTSEPVLLLGRVDPAIRRRFGPGTQFSMTFTEPNRGRYRLAALKSAYLAACLLLRSIPETPEAEAIRAELIAARDAPRKRQVQVSPLCEGLQIWKSHGPAVPGEIALVRTQPAEAAAPLIALSLARTLLVSWPAGGCLVTADSDGTPTATYQTLTANRKRRASRSGGDRGNRNSRRRGRSHHQCAPSFRSRSPRAAAPGRGGA